MYRRQIWVRFHHCNSLATAFFTPFIRPPLAPPRTLVRPVYMCVFVNVATTLRGLHDRFKKKSTTIRRTRWRGRNLRWALGEQPAPLKSFESVRWAFTGIAVDLIELENLTNALFSFFFRPSNLGPNCPSQLANWTWLPTLPPKKLLRYAPGHDRHRSNPKCCNVIGFVRVNRSGTTPRRHCVLLPWSFSKNLMKF